jgi:Arc/MetJ family transcription regulator
VVASLHIPYSTVGRYTQGMRKTTLELDDDLFERARQVLGTRGLKATVRRAFEEVVALDARQRALRQLQEMDGLDLDRPEVMGQAWR